MLPARLPGTGLQGCHPRRIVLIDKEGAASREWSKRIGGVVGGRSADWLDMNHWETGAQRKQAGQQREQRQPPEHAGTPSTRDRISSTRTGALPRPPEWRLPTIRGRTGVMRPPVDGDGVGKPTHLRATTPSARLISPMARTPMCVLYVVWAIRAMLFWEWACCLFSERGPSRPCAVPLAMLRRRSRAKWQTRYD
jgi:hypothetical protein